mgnify:CR=1 FL=1
MTNISFYLVADATTPAGVDGVLPALLQKILSAGHRVVVRCQDADRVARLNEFLWTYQPESFIPHGAENDGFKEDQPVFLTDGDDNPNGADILIRLSGSECTTFSSYARVLDLFEGSDPQKQAARKRWTELKEKGYPLEHYKCVEGKWTKIA